MRSLWLQAVALLVAALGFTGAPVGSTAHTTGIAPARAAHAAAPADCVLFNDPSEDAFPMAGPVALSLGNANYIEIVTFGLHTDGSDLVATITTPTAFLGDTGFPLSGGDWWEVDFTFKGTRYFMDATYPDADATQTPPGTPGAYGWGTLSSGGHTMMSAITGSIEFEGTHVTMRLPLKLIAGLSSGAILTNLEARSFAVVGAQAVQAPGDANFFIADDDSAPDGTTFRIGQYC